MGEVRQRGKEAMTYLLAIGTSWARRTNGPSQTLGKEKVEVREAGRAGWGSGDPVPGVPWPLEPSHEPQNSLSPWDPQF